MTWVGTILRRRSEDLPPNGMPDHVREAVTKLREASTGLTALAEETAQTLRSRGINPKSAKGIRALRESMSGVRPAVHETIERTRNVLPQAGVDPDTHRKIERIVDDMILSVQGYLGPDWLRLVNGRLHRVQAGRDFHLSIPEFAQAIQHVAILTGKPVLGVKDRKDPDNCTWIQFLDGEITLGEPCRCGGTSFALIRGHIARCSSCGTTFLAHPPPDPKRPVLKGKKGRPPPPTPLDHERSLRDYTALRLRLSESEPKERRYRGYATSPSGEPRFVVVRVPLVEGMPIPDGSSPFAWAHEIVEEGPADAGEAEVGTWDVLAPPSGAGAEESAEPGSQPDRAP